MAVNMKTHDDINTEKLINNLENDIDKLKKQIKTKRKQLRQLRLPKRIQFFNSMLNKWAKTHNLNCSLPKIIDIREVTKTGVGDYRPDKSYSCKIIFENSIKLTFELFERNMSDVNIDVTIAKSMDIYMFTRDSNDEFDITDFCILELYKIIKMAIADEGYDDLSNLISD